MRDTYPYLKDPRVLAEIRRHKWIESQKAQEEIGFASAAIDWIDKYAESWKKAHGEYGAGRELFLERRRYRRFKLHGEVSLMDNDISFAVEPLDFSFCGILCRADHRLSQGKSIMTRLSVLSHQKKSDLSCRGKVERVVEVGSKRYDLFLSFDEAGQEIIKNTLAA